MASVASFKFCVKSRLVAIIVPPMLEFSDIWSAVSLTLIGVLLSAVVSEPLRRFLLEWANLSPDRNDRDQ